MVKARKQSKPRSPRKKAVEAPAVIIVPKTPKIVVMRHLDDSCFGQDRYRFGNDMDHLIDAYLDPKNRGLYNALKLQKAIEGIKQRLDLSDELEIYHSGVTRTFYTAKGISQGIGFSGKLQECWELECRIPDELLTGQKIIVAHEPSIERFLCCEFYPRKGDAFYTQDRRTFERLN